MASTRALQRVLCVCLVLQGMGPAFESEVSQKVEDHLQIENVDPPLHSRGWTTRLSWVSLSGSQTRARAGTFSVQKDLQTSEKLVTVPGNCSEQEKCLEVRGKRLCFNESFHSKIYVEEIWLLNPDFLLA